MDSRTIRQALRELVEAAGASPSVLRVLTTGPVDAGSLLRIFERRLSLLRLSPGLEVRVRALIRGLRATDSDTVTLARFEVGSERGTLYYDQLAARGLAVVFDPQPAAGASERDADRDGA